MSADHAVDRAVGGSRTRLYAHQLVARLTLRTDEVFGTTFVHALNAPLDPIRLFYMQDACKTHASQAADLIEGSSGACWPDISAVAPIVMRPWIDCDAGSLAVARVAQCPFLQK